jgi:hypothetical protein
VSVANVSVLVVLMVLAVVSVLVVVAAAYFCATVANVSVLVVVAEACICVLVAYSIIGVFDSFCNTLQWLRLNRLGLLEVQLW